MGFRKIDDFLNIFITSDLHLSYNLNRSIQKRGFNNPIEHTRTLRNNINSVSKSHSDVLIINGDFTSDIDLARVFLKEITPKNIWLTLGNHCRKKDLQILLKEGLVSRIEHELKINWRGESYHIQHLPLREFDGFYRNSYHWFGHCVDQDTEILTNKGWIGFEDITKDHFVINLNRYSSLLEYDKINEIIKNEHTGNVYNIIGKGCDIRVTDKHTMIGMNYKKNAYIEYLADEFCNNQQRVLIKSGQFNCDGIDLSDDLLRLLVWIAADGNKCNTNLIRFRLWKKRKINRLQRLLNRLKIKYRILQQKSGVSINFTLPKELEYYNLKPIDSSIRNCNKSQADIIFEEYSHTDGYKCGKNILIYTSKKEEADTLQEMAIKNMYICNVTPRRTGFSVRDNYEVSIIAGQYRKMGNTLKCTNVEKVKKELFWCVNTNNGTIITRRNGRVTILGNCHGTMEPYLRAMDCSPDCWDLKPVPLDKIVELRSQYSNIDEYGKRIDF